MQDGKSDSSIIKKKRVREYYLIKVTEEEINWCSDIAKTSIATCS